MHDTKTARPVLRGWDVEELASRLVDPAFQPKKEQRDFVVGVGLEKNTFDSDEALKRRTAHEIVKELLRQRKETHHAPALTGRNREIHDLFLPLTARTKDTPDMSVANTLKEIDDLATLRRSHSHFTVPVPVPVPASVSQSCTTTWERKEKCAWTTGRLGSTVTSRTVRRLDVFERLSAHAKRRQEEVRQLEAGTYRQQLYSHARSLRTSHCSESMRVEDRLLEYKRIKEQKLATRVAIKQAQLLAEVRSSPQICPQSVRLCKTHTGSYTSLIARFEALEDARVKKQATLQQEKIQEELSTLTPHPQATLVLFTLLDKCEVEGAGADGVEFAGVGSKQE